MYEATAKVVDQLRDAIVGHARGENDPRWEAIEAFDLALDLVAMMCRDGLTVGDPPQQGDVAHLVARAVQGAAERVGWENAASAADEIGAMVESGPVERWDADPMHPGLPCAAFVRAVAERLPVSWECTVEQGRPPRNSAEVLTRLVRAEIRRAKQGADGQPLRTES